MKAILFAASICALLIACHRMPAGHVHESNGSSQPIPTSGGAVTGFTYHPENGKCLNASGKVGLNSLDLAAMGESKNCECVDLGKTDLVDLIPGLDPNDRLGYNVLKGYNFRGANFKQAKLHFNHFEDCDFSGAKMKGFSFGYTYIKGVRDTFTELPDEGCEGIGEGVMDCRR